jgi:hypothetical protein
MSVATVGRRLETAVDPAGIPTGHPLPLYGHGNANTSPAGAVAEAVLQLLMEHDVEGVVGAGRYERGDGRQTWATAIATANRRPASGR